MIVSDSDSDDGGDAGEQTTSIPHHTFYYLNV